MNNLNFKKILFNNAKDKIKEFINYKFEEENQSIVDKNIQIIDAIENEGNSILTTKESSKLTIEEIEEIRKVQNKKNYHFPDVLNMGILINEKSTPSDLYKENSFVSILPFYIPVKTTGISFLINNNYRKEISNALEQTVINLITSLPDGMVKLTLIDKSGSGQNFPLLNLLNKKFMDSKALSEDSQIETELERLKNDMSKTTESILKTGFKSVEDYNKNANGLLKRYEFIVIDDFPSGFNKKSTDNIIALIENGYKAGIYVFFTSQYDSRERLEKRINGIPLKKIISQTTSFDFTDRPDKLVHKNLIPYNLELINFPLEKRGKGDEDNSFRNLVNNRYKIKLFVESRANLESKIRYLNEKIEKISLQPNIHLEEIIPDEKEWYGKLADYGISVPFGKSGIENTYLNIGIDENNEKENVHHGLVCGITGSGKTVFIHDIILMSSILYSPEQVQFYLLDYKEGTEFSLYKDFPQVKILSTESEIEFGHDVLEQALTLMEERGALFKENKVNNLHGYNSLMREKNKKELPRIIVIIDEFQKLFPQDNAKLTANTNRLLQNIVKLGRSFGINLLLSTQTLQDIELDKSILSNMPLRIGLSMSEKDAIKVFGDNNTEAKFLENPGEGIYNNNSGQPKNNTYFQACNIMDVKLKKLMNRIHNYMKENMDVQEYHQLLRERFIYSGSKDGSFSNLINDNNDKIFIGESIGLNTEHMSINFRNDFAENLAIVGTNYTQASSFIMYLIEQILRKDKTARFFLNNFNAPLQEMFIKETELFDKNRFILSTNEASQNNSEEVYKEFKRREEGKLRDEPKIFIAYFFIESSKILNNSREETRKKIDEMIKSSSEYGIHILFYSVDYTTVRNQDLANKLNNFKIKIALNGGNSDKIISTEGIQNNSLGSEKIALLEKDYKEAVKFKPYIKDSIKKYVKEELND